MSAAVHDYPPNCVCGCDISHHERVGPPPFSLRLNCLDCECGRYKARVCFFCGNAAATAVLIPFAGGELRCKSGAACQRRLRSRIAERAS